MSVDLQAKRETRQAPVKAWRNWWRAQWTGQLSDGRVVLAGDETPGVVVYPSRDIARTKARDYVAAAQAGGLVCMEYIDAYPDGKSPGGAI